VRSEFWEETSFALDAGLFGGTFDFSTGTLSIEVLLEDAREEACEEAREESCDLLLRGGARLIPLFASSLMLLALVDRLWLLMLPLG
jgi:hypothetical protein